MHASVYNFVGLDLDAEDLIVARVAYIFRRGADSPFRQITLRIDPDWGITDGDVSRAAERIRHIAREYKITVSEVALSRFAIAVRMRMDPSWEDATSVALSLIPRLEPQRW